MKRAEATTDAGREDGRRDGTLTGCERVQLEDALYQRFLTGGSGGRRTLRYLRKKYAWRLTV